MGECIERSAAIKAAKHAWAKGLEPSQLERQHPTYEQLYPFRRGEVIYIHPKGRFISVRTETAGGPVVENFRLCEAVM